MNAPVSNSARNRTVSAPLRAGSAAEHRLPVRYWHTIDGFLSRHLQREQRPRQPLTPDQRAALIPRIADDVRLLEQVTGESFSEWLDAQRRGHRVPLSLPRRIGTAHGSIDRPLRDDRPSGAGLW